jgi:hypothetical protein
MDNRIFAHTEETIHVNIFLDDSLFLIKIIIRNSIYILETDKEIEKEDFETA